MEIFLCLRACFRVVHTSVRPILKSAISQEEMRLLANKMDELAALARRPREYCVSSVLCLKETWLLKDIPDSTVDSFQTIMGGQELQAEWPEERWGTYIYCNEIEQVVWWGLRRLPYKEVKFIMAAPSHRKKLQTNYLWTYFGHCISVK